jgi:hypothetical protein
MNVEAADDFAVGKKCPNSPIFTFIHVYVQKCTCWKAMSLAPVRMKIFILWDVTPCSLVKLYRHILQHCSLHASMTFETLYIFNCSGGTKCPVTFVQFFRQKSTESRMLHNVLTTLGIIVFVAVALLHVVLSYDWSWLRRRSDCKKIDLIPGPKTLPFFGNVFLFHVPEESKCLRKCHKLITKFTFQ